MHASLGAVLKTSPTGKTDTRLALKVGVLYSNHRIVRKPQLSTTWASSNVIALGRADSTEPTMQRARGAPLQCGAAPRASCCSMPTASPTRAREEKQQGMAHSRHRVKLRQSEPFVSLQVRCRRVSPGVSNIGTSPPPLFDSSEHGSFYGCASCSTAPALARSANLQLRTCAVPAGCPVL